MFVKLSAVFGLGVAFVASPALAGEPLASHQFADGSVIVAVPVRAASDVGIRAIRHVIVLDTSASQSGQYRLDTLETARATVANLPGDHSVLVYAADVGLQALTPQAVRPGSAELAAAFEAAARRIPAGDTNLLAALTQIVAASSASEPTSVLYIGDAISAVTEFSAAELNELTSLAVVNRVSISSVAYGPRLDVALMGTLALHTGGVVRAPVDQAAAVSAAELGMEAAAALANIVVYPTTLQATCNSQSVVSSPATAVPLRTDRDTIYLAQLPTGGTMELQLLADAATVGASTVSLTDSRHHDGMLANLWHRAALTDGVANPLAGGNLFEEARVTWEASLQESLRQADAHLTAGRVDDAREVVLAAAALAPDDMRLKQFQDKIELVSTHAVSVIAQDQFFNAAPAQNDAFADRTDAPQGDEVDPIKQYEALQKVASQRLQKQVNDSIQDSLQLFTVEPGLALNQLKTSQGTVRSATDIDPQVRAQLERKLVSVIGELEGRRAAIEIGQIRSQQARSEIEARRRLTEQAMVEEERLERLLDQVRALLEQGVHGNDVAFSRAEAVADLAVNLRPGNGPATAARFTAEAAGQLNDAFRLRAARADKLLAVLTQVELSHVPFPDEPPVVYPLPEVWKDLSERRKIWASVDLRIEGPNEARIRRAMEDQTEFEFVDTPLRLAMDQIEEIHNITILIDEKAIVDAGLVTPDETVTQVISGITLRSALKILLEPLELTWVIEDEVMKITTQAEADTIQETRVYPVADLVIPVQPLQGGGGGGLGGGIGGGQQGGIGGGQQGGFGGGGGGGGQGFFSIP